TRPVDDTKDPGPLVCDDHCGGSASDESGKHYGNVYVPPADPPKPKPKPKHWWDKAAHWVDDHKAEIAGFAAGVVAFSICEAATEGAGTYGCMIAASAVSNVVTDAVNGNIHSIGDALHSLAVGAVQGALAVPLAIADGVKQVGTIASDVKHGNYMGALGHAALLGLDVATVADGVRGPKEGGSRPREKCSFTGATLVLLANGTTKPIQSIQTGDQVESTDTATGKNVPEPVTELHVNQDTDPADITVQDAKGHTAVLHTTAHHRLWNQSTGQWTPAADLKRGAQLHSVNGDVEYVMTVRTWTGLTGMYDLTVATTHTFYVLVGGVPLLVHNCGTASPHSLNRTESLSGNRSAAKVAEITDSMRENGWQGDPIETYKVGNQRYVINGHHRVAAAKQAGIDVKYRDISLEELQAYGYSTPDDVITAWAENPPDRLGRPRRR
ncbi:MAG: ParB N-terminal domain-containing protein, partial [Mycobacterium sp.]|nr:ParB N-terminal domain-containing protein [Mycobacterium sp.]